MRFFTILLMVLGSFSLAARTPDSVGVLTMPLEEIKPGMTGEWETVIQGTETQRFGFEVVGVVPNFIGPKQPAILALATDASQILSGPVAGMSGSPCYIDGKLIGAYAYGFTWPKEQALIGITPIADMFTTLEKEAARSAEPAASGQVKQGRAEDFHTRLKAWGDVEKIQALLAGAEAESSAGPSNTALAPLPTPLLASGISETALELFAPRFKALGLDTMAAPMGSSGDLKESHIFAGSALAGVMMQGDFSMAGVGTVTWREGDTFLAFGHPFFGTGNVEIPAAPAEILTVVRSVQTSFKLSNVGPIVGSIRQDRLTSISGEIGQMTTMTPVHYSVQAHDGETRDYQGEVFRDREMSPLLIAIGLFESLLQTMEFALEQTLTLRSQIALEGHEPLVFERVATGPVAAMQLVLEQWLLLGLLADNPFEETTIKDVNFSVEQRLGWDRTTLEAVRKLSGRARPGEPWRLGLTFGRYLQQPAQNSITIPIPAGTFEEKLRVFVGDAHSADRIERGNAASTVTSFDGLLRFLRDSRSNDRAYVMLLRSAPGLRIDGQDLSALPPTARLLLNSERQDSLVSESRWQTLWEDSIAVPGVFSGSHFINLNVQ